MAETVKGEFAGTLLGIKHGFRHDDLAPVRKIFRQFLPHVRPDNTLYIEFPEKELPSPGTATRFGAGYDLLINHARERGMRIVALDTPRLVRVVRKLEEQPRMAKLAKRMGGALKTYVDPQRFSRLMYLYGLTELRERRWVNIIRNSKKGDVIVMHPNHAARIAERLNISGKNLVFLHEPELRPLEWYKKTLATGAVREARRNMQQYNSLRARRPATKIWRVIRRAYANLKSKLST